MADIYKALANAMADIRPIAKGKRNQQQGFMFRGVDDIMNALQPIFVKHNIFVIPEVLEQMREKHQTSKGGTLFFSIFKIRYTFFTLDGSGVSAIVIGEAMDSGDKGSNKAMSAGFKYACLQTLCIPTEEMKDPDFDTPPKIVTLTEEQKKAVIEANAQFEENMKNVVATTEQIDKIKDGIGIVNTTEEAICKKNNVKSLSELSRTNAQKIIDAMNRLADEK